MAQFSQEVTDTSASRYYAMKVEQEYSKNFISVLMFQSKILLNLTTFYQARLAYNCRSLTVIPSGGN